MMAYRRYGSDRNYGSDRRHGAGYQQWGQRGNFHHRQQGPSGSLPIHGYNGYYKRHALEMAKFEFQNVVDNMDTVIWRRIRMKCGIHRPGERQRQSDGWGTASIYFSHADSYENNEDSIIDFRPTNEEIYGGTEEEAEDIATSDDSEQVVVSVEVQSGPSTVIDTKQSVKHSSKRIVSSTDRSMVSNKEKDQPIFVDEESDTSTNQSQFITIEPIVAITEEEGDATVQKNADILIVNDESSNTSSQDSDLVILFEERKSLLKALESESICISDSP